MIAAENAALRAAAQKFKASKKALAAGLPAERRAKALARGVAFQEDEVKHEHNLDKEARKALKKKGKTARGALLARFDTEKAHQLKASGVTDKRDFIIKLELFLLKEMKLKRDKVIELAYADTIKKFIISFQHLLNFWKEIDREKEEEDKSIEMEHFNNYDNENIKEKVEKPLLKILKTYQSKHVKDPPKCAALILELFVELGKLAIDEGLEEVETKKFAGICKEMTKLDESRDPGKAKKKAKKGRKKLNRNRFKFLNG